MVLVQKLEVALRKESVDRNWGRIEGVPRPNKSLSARRAWIEIGTAGHQLRWQRRRSPQGERG